MTQKLNDLQFENQSLLSSIENAKYEIEKLSIELEQRTAKAEKLTSELRTQLEDSLAWTTLLVNERDRLAAAHLRDTPENTAFLLVRY